MTRKIKNIRHTSSNALVHSENASYLFLKEIEEINAILIENRLDKVNYEKKKEILKNMMTNISHDLRTPLTSALGYIEMILNCSLSEEERNNELKIVFQKLKRLEELMQTFFEFSKMDNHIIMENVNVIAILKQCIAGYYEDYNKEKRQIQF